MKRTFIPHSPLAALAVATAMSALVAFPLACGPTGTGPGDGDGDGDGGTDEDPDAEACEHMAEGPEEAVTATDGPSGAPSVSAEHTRFDVTLIDDGAGMYTGSVIYEAAEAGDYLLYLDNDVPFALLDASGAAVAVEASDAVTLCTEVAIRHTAELAVGTTEIVLGPTDAPVVSLVIEGAGDHAEEE